MPPLAQHLPLDLPPVLLPPPLPSCVILYLPATPHAPPLPDLAAAISRKKEDIGERPALRPVGWTDDLL